MAGAPRGESDIAQQSTDPILPSAITEDETSSPYNKSRVSASNVMEKISGVFQPGDNESTTRRRADVPPGVSTTRLQGQTQGEEEGEGEGKGKGESKTMLQGAQETVARALGGGPRGSR